MKPIALASCLTLFGIAGLAHAEEAPIATDRPDFVESSLTVGDRRLQVETSGLFAPYWHRREPEPWLPALRRAIREGHRVNMRYRDAEGRDSMRMVWPFAMAFLDDLRLLAAWCEMRGDFRHFRADRVLALEDTGCRYPDHRHQLLRRWRQQCLPTRDA